MIESRAIYTMNLVTECLGNINQNRYQKNFRTTNYRGDMLQFGSLVGRAMEAVNHVKNSDNGAETISNTGGIRKAKRVELTTKTNI